MNFAQLAKLLSGLMISHAAQELQRGSLDLEKAEPIAIAAYTPWRYLRRHYLILDLYVKRVSTYICKLHNVARQPCVYNQECQDVIREL
jgi:hypothetical protein